MRKIYITGGSGFVGTHLCQRLSDHQIPFVIIDVKKSRRFPDKTKLADIRELDKLLEAMQDIGPNDTIVHLAAVHRDDVRDPNLYHSTNVAGTKNVCEAASALGVKNIIFTSSVAVYGFAPVGTDENGEINPFNEYGRTKYMGEEIITSWQMERDERKLLIVRPTVIFGPGNRGNVYNLLNQIASGRFLMVGGGSNRKSMAYVENVAAFLHHGISVNKKRTVVNYVDDPDLSMKSLVTIVRNKIHGKNGVGIQLPYWVGLGIGYFADLLSKLTGKKLPVSSIRIKKFCSNSSFSSAKGSVGGFSPPVTIEQGLIDTINSEFINPDPNREIFYTE